MSTKQAVNTVKGNKTTEVVVGTAANKLAQALTGITTAVDSLKDFQEKIDQNTLKIVEQEDRMLNLEQDLKNKVAQNKIELNIQYQTDKKVFIDNYLQSEGLVAVSADTLTNLQTKLQKTIDEVEQSIKSEVGKAVGIERAKSTSDLKVAELEHKNALVANQSEIAQLKSQNSFLMEQVESWRNQLNSERSAATERAKASSIGSVNIGGPQGK